MQLCAHSGLGRTNGLQCAIKIQDDFWVRHHHLFLRCGVPLCDCAWTQLQQALGPSFRHHPHSNRINVPLDDFNDLDADLPLQHGRNTNMWQRRQTRDSLQWLCLDHGTSIACLDRFLLHKLRFQQEWLQQRVWLQHSRKLARKPRFERRRRWKRTLERFV